MTYLSLSLFGVPKVTIDGNAIKAPTIHAVPLLAYMAITGTFQTREHIANLLWSDSNLRQGLAALRTTLWRLKSVGLDKWLIIERDTISLSKAYPIDVDVLEFRKRLDLYKSHGHPISQVCLSCIPNLSEAVDLYRGEFFSGVSLPGSHVFDDWRTQEGESLHSSYVNMLERITKGHRMLGDINLSIHYAQMLLKEDQYNEAAYYDLMQLYSINGQRSTAISLYKRYQDLLFRELGLQPSPEITELHKHILGDANPFYSAQKEKNPIFLVADIENSSFLWEQAGSERTAFLTIFNSIFKETAARFGGYILQNSDDKITLLFDKGQPLHCAVTIHIKVKNTNWGSMGTPALRMVIYSAITEDETGIDFTTATSNASKLLSMTWGGQIIFTERVLQTIEQPPGSKIRDLGYYSLRDSKPSIHVLELLHPHIAGSNHTSLHPGVSNLVNFPHLTPEFIGREAELDVLGDIFQPPDARLITLIGPGGVGKTRLAVQFAHQNAGRFTDGAYFIPLASIEDSNQIPIALAEALNFRFFGTENHIEQLENYLQHSKVLLVFDNFEHLRTIGVEFIAHLLEKTQSLKILITSRERMNLLSESVLDIQGLPVNTSDEINEKTPYGSITLFIRNAKRNYPKFNDQKNAHAIVRICRLLNGLPLGIILASSWVRLYTCQQIVEEIEKDLDFLKVSAVDLPARHRSLRVVFDSSWKLLSNEERLVMSRLSIFPVNFSKEAAQDICNASPTLLSSLIDKSLLLHQDGRFKMLDTFHQYSASKLEALGDEKITIQNKFINYYSDFCFTKNQELSTSKQRRALDDMISDIDNIRTAWSWMIESNRWSLVYKIRQSILAYHIITAKFVEGREFFNRALEKLEELNDPSLLLIHTSLVMLDAWLMVRIGFIAKGYEILTACLETFRLHRSPWNIIMAQMFTAESERLLGNFTQAKKHILEALDAIEDGGFTTNTESIAIQGNCQSILGVINLELDELEEASINLQTSLATQLKVGAYWGSIHPIVGMGKLAFIRGDFIKARDLYLQALATAEEMYDPRGMAMLHNNIGAVYEVIVNPPESYNHFTNGLRYCNETGDRRLKALILNNLAYHHLRFLSNYSEAIHIYHEAIQLFIDLGNLRGVAYAYYDISKAYLKVGLVHESWEYCIRSLHTAMTLDSVPIVLHALHGFAHFYLSTGEVERSYRLCCLIDSHPQVEQDTRKRAVVTRVMIEPDLSAEAINAADQWGKIAGLQEVIDQILSDAKY